MKKILVFLVTLLVVIGNANAAGLRQMQLEIVDEFWQPVTNITQVTVFDAGTNDEATIFADRAGTISVTNPITTSSTNSTLTQVLGLVQWFQTAPDYKVTITDDTKVLTIDNMNSTFIRFPWYFNYIGTAASLSVGDNEEISVGDQADMVLSWNNSGDFMSWIPGADGSAFNLGTSGTSKNVDFNWFVDTALGIKGDEGAATLIIDGLTVSINTDSNFATNINTGSSTGAVTIGSSTSGTLALDTDGGMTINADTSIAITTSAGTIGLGATGGDITIHGVDSSVVIRGTEAASDAILIDADAGSIDIDSADNLDIDVADDITIDTAGGVIELTSVDGDITLDATNKSVNIDGGETDQAAVKIDASAGGGGVTIDAGTLGITMSGAIVKNYIKEIEVEAGTSETVLAADSGKVFVNTIGTGTTTYTLPTAAAGLTFTFIDSSATAADELWITANTGDAINNGSLAKSFKSVAASVPSSVTLTAITAGSWEVVAISGTWVNDNN